MLTDPLPTTLDVRKAAVRGVSISGALKPLELQRFRGLLASDDGVIQAHLAFNRDEEGRYLVTVDIEADVSVTCQRCLEPMPTTLQASNTLAAVWSDEQARHLPKHLDPLILTEEACVLRDLVEDELILSLPPYSYHEQADCNEELVGLAASEPKQEQREEKPNPFEVLAQLKPGEKH
ncbi:YceD family protein [Parahaliea mediterranea]|uniref:YceD family protein n=1 Tax=Parahaliea mediterranea TaxID=651086 RepID=UPI000E2F78AA|nr:YceD family protein [Parahaliea mediterranea]